MIQNRNRDRLIADLSAQIAPAAARTPGGFAFFAFAGQIDSVHAGVVELRHGSSSPARVGENFRFVRGHFQGTHDAQAEHPVLRISKDYLFVLCAQSRDAVHASEIRPTAKHKARSEEHTSELKSRGHI